MRKYESITKKIGDTEKSLLPSLNDEQLKQYYDCVTLLLAREGVCAEEMFERAFVLGARAVIEMMSGDKISV